MTMIAHHSPHSVSLIRATEGDFSVSEPTKKGKKTSNSGFSAEERAAMRERARELKSAARAEEGESSVLAKIADMPEPDRTMGMRLHEIIRANAPGLLPKLWYGMPAYAKDGEVVCFFQSAAKFNVRYSTFGFSDKAALDDGNMWPASFALKELTPAEEAIIAELVKKAVS